MRDHLTVMLTCGMN